MLSFPVQVGGPQWAAPGGKRVQKIRYVLTVNQNNRGLVESKETENKRKQEYLEASEFLI
jgi:hypothetical protein